MYRIGTVSINDGDYQLNGTNTDWITVANVKEGYLVMLPDNQFYLVTAVTSDTNIEIQRLLDGGPYSGPNLSGASYAMMLNALPQIDAALAQKQIALLVQWRDFIKNMQDWLFTTQDTAVLTSHTGQSLEVYTPTGLAGLQTIIPEGTEQVLQDLNAWSEQSSETGQNYQALLFNVTEALAKANTNALNINLIKNQVDTLSDSINKTISQPASAVSTAPQIFMSVNVAGQPSGGVFTRTLKIEPLTITWTTPNISEAETFVLEVVVDGNVQSTSSHAVTSPATANTPLTFNVPAVFIDIAGATNVTSVDYRISSIAEAAGVTTIAGDTDENLINVSIFNTAGSLS